MEKLEIIKKAWRVHHPGMIHENPHLGFPTIGDIPVTYAETRNLARTNIMSAAYQYALDGVDGYEDPTYLTVNAVRAKGMDMVMFEGRETKRWCVKASIEERKATEKRIKEFEKFPEDAEYYVQNIKNGYCGNSPYWWGKNSSGYTCDIDKAHRYTKSEIILKFTNKRDEDIIWLAEHVETAIRKHVDSQYLKSGYCVF
jgi:hypothetical protein